MNSLQGHLLVASPQLLDPNFVQSVVLMVQHDEDGAMGLIVNRPTTTKAHEAWAKICHTPCHRREPLYQGGPCEGPLMAIHACDHMAQLQVFEGVFFTTEKDSIEWLVEQNQGPMKLFVGCAGWAPGQLEDELNTGSWLTYPASSEFVFSTDPDHWISVTKQIARSMSDPVLNPKIVPRDPSLN